MDYNLLTVVIGTLIELACLLYIARLARTTKDKMDADDAALYLQGRRIEDVLREMRGELTR